MPGGLEFDSNFFWKMSNPCHIPCLLPSAGLTLVGALLILANLFLIFIIISAIAVDHDSLFEKDQDILVLLLDSVKFDTHKQLTQDVLKYFGKVHLHVVFSF